MKRTILALILLASSALAETVVMSDNGKTFHAKDTCNMLRKSKALYEAERSEAEAHGLTPCRTCYKIPAAPKPAKNAWGKLLAPKLPKP